MGLKYFCKSQKQRLQNVYVNSLKMKQQKNLKITAKVCLQNYSRIWKIFKEIFMGSFYEKWSFA